MKKLPKKLRDYILRRDKFACKRCGVGAEYAELNVNHIIPRHQDGENDLDNLATLCRMCHREWEIIEPMELTAKLDEFERFVGTVPLRYLYACQWDERADLKFGQLLENLYITMEVGNRKPILSDLHINLKPIDSGVKRAIRQKKAVAAPMNELERWVFMMRRDGYTWREVADFLNESGERNHLGKLFTAQYVSKMVSRLYNSK